MSQRLPVEEAAQVMGYLLLAIGVVVPFMDGIQVALKYSPLDE